MTRRALATGAASLAAASLVPAPRRLPQLGDVVISIRFPQPTAAAAVAAYRPDRIEWHYANDPAFVAAAKHQIAGGYVGGAINANPPLSDPSGYARDFDGKIVVAPWMTWGAKWATTASPVTRAALFDWAAKSLAAGCDGLQVDDGWFQWASETWGVGDFSAASLAGFGPWLARNVPARERKALRLPSGPGFDYRAWLRRTHGISSAADYEKRRNHVPTTPLWRRYLASSVLAFWSELRGRVNAPLSSNFGWLLPREMVVALADRLDYTASELPVIDPPWKYSLYGATAEAAGLPFVGCFIGRASPTPLRQMIAAAYANGIVPAAPWDLWVPSEAGVTQPRDFPDPAHFTDLYDFVRANRGLFDGWRGAGEIGVVVPARAYDEAAVDAVVRQFARVNAPFRILFADSDYRRVPLGGRELAGLSAVVLAQPPGDYSKATLAAVAGLRRELDPRPFSLGALTDPDWRLTARRRGPARLFHLTPMRFGAGSLEGHVTLHGRFDALRLHRPHAPAVTLTPVRQAAGASVYAVPDVRDWAILEPLG